MSFGWDKTNQNKSRKKERDEFIFLLKSLNPASENYFFLKKMLYVLFVFYLLNGILRYKEQIAVL